MNPALWPALREYISAEIALSHARRDLAAKPGCHPSTGFWKMEREEIARLEAQVTRMETAVREGLILDAAGAEVALRCPYCGSGAVVGEVIPHVEACPLAIAASGEERP